MEFADFSNPGEKKKLIWAAILGLIAIVFLWWTFIGFGKSTPSAPARPSTTSSTLGSRPSSTRATNNVKSAPEPQLADMSYMQEVVLQGPAPSVPEPRRNIFA